MATPPATSFTTLTTSEASSYPSSSTSDSSTTASTPYVALTTPFKAPGSCFQDFRHGSLTVTKEGYYDETSVTLLNANISGTHSSCFPTGFGTATFFPAVCPSGWTYYTIHTAQEGSTLVTLANKATIYEARTSAVCCASGFSATESPDTYPLPIRGCFQKVESHSTTIEVLSNYMPYSGFSETTAKLFTGGGYLRHEPLYIGWYERDLSSLSPPPPTLGDNRFIPTWAPGGKITTHKAYPRESDDDRYAPLVRFFKIGLPIIIVFTIGCSIWCCICCKRKRRRDRRKRQKREARAAAAEIATQVGAVEAPTAAEVRANAELAEAIEMVERHRASEAAGQVTPPRSETPRPRHSFDNDDDEPLPPYSKDPPGR